MKIRMKVAISGTVNGQRWPAPGGELDIDDAEAASLIARGAAVAVDGDTDADGTNDTEAVDGDTDADGTNDTEAVDGDSDDAVETATVEPDETATKPSKRPAKRPTKRPSKTLTTENGPG